MNLAVSALKMSPALKVKWLMTVLLPASILLIPSNAVFTREVRWFLVITLWSILCFALELLDNTIPAVFLPFLYTLLGVAPVAVVLAPWTTEIPWMCLGCFIWANILERTGLLRRIALWCVVKTGGTYLGILFGVVLLGMVTRESFSTAAFCYGICKALHLEKSAMSSAIMIAGAFSSIGTGFYFYDPTNLGVLLGVAGLEVTFTEFLLQNIVFVPLSFLLVPLLYKMFKPVQQISGKAYFEEEREKLGPMSVSEKKAALVMVLLIVGLIAGVPMIINFLLLPLICFLPGIRLGESQDIDRVNFKFLFFVTGCMSIGMAANNLGLGTLISDMLQPYLTNLSTVGLVTIVWILAMLVNFLLTPLAAMAAFGVPLVQIAADLGVNPLPIMYAFYQGLDQVIFPYEYALYMVPFSFGLVRMHDFMKAFAMKMGVAFLYLLVIGIPFWKFIGLL